MTTRAVPAAIQDEENVTSVGSVNKVPSLRTKFTVMLVLPPAARLATPMPMMPAWNPAPVQDPMLTMP